MQTQQELAHQVVVLEQENAFLKEELAQLKRLVFGNKKERYIPTGSAQQSLFDEPQQPETPEVETVSYERKSLLKKVPPSACYCPHTCPGKKK